MDVMFISGIVTRGAMARSKTGSFTLTETVLLTAAATPVQATVDIGSLVDVGDQQGFAIESVDIIYQALDTNGDPQPGVSAFFAADAATQAQLSDLNPGTQLIRADDTNLIASGQLYYDAAFIVSVGPDLFPDNFGKLDESRMVVNDQLYCVAECATAGAVTASLAVTFRIRGRIVKLSTKDWIAIAVTTVAND